MKIKKNLFAIFFICVGGFLFAENWFVCLSSFRSPENAEIFCSQLSENNINSWIYFSRTEKGDFYRVLYSKTCNDSEEARILRDKIDSSKVAKKLALNGLWILKAQKEAENSETAIPATTISPAATEKNTATAAPETEKIEPIVLDVETSVPEVPAAITEPEVITAPQDTKSADKLKVIQEPLVEPEIPEIEEPTIITPEDYSDEK
ncbi:MAG: SPOR domain-containing protein [Treponema sp.]|nr:SPOR domain-containing protein [Treponema sp.]